MRRPGDPSFGLGRGKVLLLIAICMALPLSACGGDGGDDDKDDSTVTTAGTSGNRFDGASEEATDGTSAQDADTGATGLGPSDTNSPDPSDASQSSYLRAVDGICAAASQDGEEEFQAFFRENEDAQLEEFVRAITVPALKAEIAKIEALGPPPSSSREMDAFLDAFEKALSGADRNLQRFAGDVSKALAKTNKLAKGYGLKNCVTRTPPNTPIHPVAKLKTSSLTKAEFLKTANAICQKREQQHLDEANGYLEEVGEGGDPTGFNYMSKRFGIPAYRDKLDQLIALGAPAGEGKKVEDLVNEFQSGLERMEASPDPAGTETVLIPIAENFEEYGLKYCPS